MRINIVKLISAVIVILLVSTSVVVSNGHAEDSRFNMTYIHYPSTSAYVETVEQTQEALDVVSPNYFDISSEGELEITSKLDTSFIEEMHARGVKVVPFLSNHWDRTSGENALENMETLVNDLAEAVETYQLDGINVDIEGLNHTHRDDFTSFVRLLREVIPAELEVSVAVAANPRGWETGWHGMYDYAKLAQHSDYLMIMSYDEHSAGSEPGPVASYNFTEQSIQYALDQGVHRDKIVLGLPFYGRLWQTETPDMNENQDDAREEDLTNNETEAGHDSENESEIGSNSGEEADGEESSPNQEQTQPAPITGSGVPLFRVNELVDHFDAHVERVGDRGSKATFTVSENDEDFNIHAWSDPLSPGQYELWFDDDTLIRQKLDLVHEYNIKGTGSWSLGQENSSIWQYYRLWLDGKRFEDVSVDHWARESVMRVEYNGWIVGKTLTQFAPSDQVTRREAATILVRAMNLQAEESISNPSFQDVTEDMWGYSAIEIAKQHGIFAGKTEGLFKPNDPITRQELAVVFKRLFELSELSDTHPFPDVNPDTAPWSYAAIASVKENNVFGGFSDGTFRPKAPTTRAEMAALMVRLSHEFE
ncbi:S-layer homology domain-containing protein [Caldalkalibacillus salinus]|uniref:S-layer homology domain-containing protein n=1 Tax=Caldalkalibacillus salinus TaxID=2803787 RepID=UPI00192509A0|nr:S-layer homology domain-containing protein [Caldalkalibacillus salinus]